MTLYRIQIVQGRGYFHFEGQFFFLSNDLVYSNEKSQQSRRKDEFNKPLIFVVLTHIVFKVNSDDEVIDGVMAGSFNCTKFLFSWISFS